MIVVRKQGHDGQDQDHSKGVAQEEAGDCQGDGQANRTWCWLFMNRSWHFIIQLECENIESCSAS